MPDLHMPGDVLVDPPVPPNVATSPPRASTVVVVPVAGPQGARGPAGDSSETLGFVHTQSSPVTTLQITHDLPFQPAGIACLASGDACPLLGVTVSYPTIGIVELGFGVPFTGIVRLS